MPVMRRSRWNFNRPTRTKGDAEVVATYAVEFRFPDPEYVSRTKRGNWGDVLTEMDDFT